DLIGINVETGDQDHVLDTVDDADKTVLVDHRHIAGTEPALAVHDFGSCLGTLPVALHDLGPLHAEFATFADWQLIALLVDHLDRGTGHRQTDGTEAGQAVARAGADHRGTLGQTITLADEHPRLVLPTLGGGLDQRCAAGSGALEPGE